MNTSNNADINGLVRVHYKQCDSTQSRLKYLLSKTRPSHGFTITADYQSEGRGQVDSKWNSSPGLNLAMSILLEARSLHIDRKFLFNIWMSMAVVDVLKTYVKDELLKIKWPNDIMVNDRKIAGILIQTGVRRDKIKHAIGGIGLNVNEPMQHYDFPATSLREIVGETIDRHVLQEKLLAEIIQVFDRGIKMPRFEIFKPAYEKRMWRINEQVAIRENGIQKTCTVHGINDTGQLVATIDEEKRQLNNKEIEFIRKKV